MNTVALKFKGVLMRQTIKLASVISVAHTGLTDGTGPTNASNNMAEIYNRLLLQIQATIVASGLTPDPNNWTQLPEAIVQVIS